MKKIRIKSVIFLYLLFTAVCGCLSLIFATHGIFVIQIWYHISMILWICLEITIIRLLIRLQKTSKLKMRKINGRREKS